MTLQNIAVIDIGKTSAKLVLLDASDGAELLVRIKANQVLQDGPYPHADVEGLFYFIVASLKEFGDNHPVSAISITTHGATAAILAGSDLALPVLDYEHTGPDNLREAYAAVRPDFAESLSPQLPGGLNLGAQFFWQQSLFPDAFASVTSILTYPQYWAFRLTGELASEVTSLGCHTDLWAPAHGAFSSMVGALGWTDLFPPLRRADEVIGTVTSEIAALTGLSQDTPVTVGIHDSNASLLPHLKASSAPFNVISSGTWTIQMHVGGGTDWLDPERDSLANVDYLGRPVPTSRFMGGREYATLAGPDAPAPSPPDANRVIARGIMAIPSFTPGVGPFPHHVGHIEGDADSLTAAERAAMASLYLALNSTFALGICGTGTYIIVEGPLARNLVYLATLQQLTGVPVSASADATGTSLGAALLFNNVPFGDKIDHSAYEYVETKELVGLAKYAAHWRELASARPLS